MDLTAIIDKYRTPFNQQYGSRATQQINRAIGAVVDCHTERHGKILLHCSPCDNQQSYFHACGHRSCNRCQHHDTARWLERQTQKLLPVDYFMVTFTLPYQLRALVWHHQKRLYSMLFECAVSTLKKFGVNDEKLGSEVAMTAVLHTHSHRLEYHPHVHIVVPGGCFNQKRQQWHTLKGQYLFNAFNLATVFRGKFLEALRQTTLTEPDAIPKQWVVDCQHVGRGLPAIKYLSRYLYRGVVSEKNIISDDGTNVTFRYRESQSGDWKTRCVKGEYFIWLVFQHALPKSFRRVRDFWFLHGNAKITLRRIQLLLKVFLPTLIKDKRPVLACKHCGNPMAIIAFIPPAWRAG